MTWWDRINLYILTLGGVCVFIYIVMNWANLTSLQIALVFFSEVHWLALVPAVLGIFESIIHVVGIKIHHLKHFYFPGMATALLLLLPTSIFITIYAAPGVTWQWILTFAYYFAVFICMEIAVWGVFGLKVKDLPKTIKKARAYALRK